MLDDTTLEQLYTRLERRMYNAVYRWVWNQADAEEIVQEAFVKLWKMRDRVDVATVQPLVWRIALNLASNRRRSKKLWSFVTLESWTATDGANTEARASQNELDARVRDAISRLPENLRRVVLLTEVAGLSYDEASATLQIPVGTVGSRRNKALGLLRVSLVELHDELAGERSEDDGKQREVRDGDPA